MNKYKLKVNTMMNLLNGLNGGGLRWASVGRNYWSKWIIKTEYIIKHNDGFFWNKMNFYFILFYFILFYE